MFGRITIDAPRFEGCRSCDQQHAFSPVSRLLPNRSLPELCHLQAKLSAELPYRRATALLRELLPNTGGLTPVTTRQRTLAVGGTIEQELCQEVEHPSAVPEPAEHLTVGIDGAFVKAKRDGASQRQHFEILTGRVERKRERGQAFAVVRDLDQRAKQKVQAFLRRCGRGPNTKVTVLSDGEDGLRGVVGWFGKQCQHRLDWFHVARRLEKIRKDLLYLPPIGQFGRQLAFHSRNIDTIKHMLWNDGIEMAEFGMTDFRIGLLQHASTLPEEKRIPFRILESKLDELRSYLYANRESVRGYAHRFRSGNRVSTAHVEQPSTNGLRSTQGYASNPKLRDPQHHYGLT